MGPATKKQPMRMCVGCNKMHSKRSLIRVVRTADGNLAVDVTGKRPGRGAYICPATGCLEAALRDRRFERCFGRCPDPEVILRIREEIAKE